MTTRTRIGFIGAGGIANRHLNDLLGFDDVSVTAFSDPVLSRAQELAQRSGGKAYDSFTRMLDEQELDALYICVPPFAHGEPESTAIERKLPFFVEKPLAVDWDTAETIATRVASQNLVTAVGYHWRYLDTTEEVQELLAKNP